jgi:hypothetical protein
MAAFALPDHGQPGRCSPPLQRRRQGRNRSARASARRGSSRPRAPPSLGPARAHLVRGTRRKRRRPRHRGEGLCGPARMSAARIRPAEARPATRPTNVILNSRSTPVSLPRCLHGPRALRPRHQPGRTCRACGGPAVGPVDLEDPHLMRASGGGPGRLHRSRFPRRRPRGRVRTLSAGASSWPYPLAVAGKVS